MKAPRLDRSITLQTLTVTRGASGGIVNTWADTATLYAGEIESSGTESRVDGALHASESRTMIIRYRSGITAGACRFVYQSKNYDIAHVGEPPNSRREYLILSGAYTEGRP